LVSHKKYSARLCKEKLRKEKGLGRICPDFKAVEIADGIARVKGFAIDKGCGRFHFSNCSTQVNWALQRTKSDKVIA
jgi:hypothetical protein